MSKSLLVYELENIFISLKAHGFKTTISDIIFDIKHKTYK